MKMFQKKISFANEVINLRRSRGTSGASGSPAIRYSFLIQQTKRGTPAN